MDLLTHLGCPADLREDSRLPGAVWYIFHRTEADSLRAALNQHHRKDVNTDMLDAESAQITPRFLKFLKSKYHISPKVVPQYVGDAILLPVGSPHEV